VNCNLLRSLGGEDNYGDYEWQTYAQALKRRDNIASGLANLTHLAVGDFVGLYSINRPEWLLSDLACSHQGLASIALYDTVINSII
jgi:long-chain acyl-CoA synthetase